jgi:tRNA 5-methylaminomethyl-2-thiouridine biosynthesis bifunctional protein
VGRVAWRAQTYDRLPVAGPVADRSAFNTLYAKYHQDRKRRQFDPAPCLPGLFVTSGHAARGSVSCTLAGEVVAAQICGEASPLNDELQAFLNPNRFLIRDLKS